MKSESEYYTPLPNCLTIKASTIHGLGTFATTEIPEGLDLGESHFMVNGEMKRTPLGGFINHSVSPNVIRVGGPDSWRIIALRNIKAGEELTLRYSLYDPS